MKVKSSVIGQKKDEVITLTTRSSEKDLRVQCICRTNNYGGILNNLLFTHDGFLVIPIAL